jgi:hypothetical protein
MKLNFTKHIFLSRATSLQKLNSRRIKFLTELHSGRKLHTTGEILIFPAAIYMATIVLRQSNAKSFLSVTSLNDCVSRRM